jgi:hypothetical protein
MEDLRNSPVKNGDFILLTSPNLEISKYPYLMTRFRGFGFDNTLGSLKIKVILPDSREYGIFSDEVFCFHMPFNKFPGIYIPRMEVLDYVKLSRKSPEEVIRSRKSIVDASLNALKNPIEHKIEDAFIGKEDIVDALRRADNAAYPMRIYASVLAHSQFFRDLPDSKIF